MAVSYSHKWGQIIGDVLEFAIRQFLQKIASEHNLYLDYKKSRKARPGKKVSWQDKYGNSHDLDYVIERGGTENTLGLPVAFIEIAWRRYTKHSRNKAQEIEGAIVPLSQTYNHLHPFLGIILAGEFTSGSLSQLKSKGFTVLYLDYASIIKAFNAAGIVASFNEDTPENEFKKKIKKWKTFGTKDIQKIVIKLLNIKAGGINTFRQELIRSIARKVTSITVLALHGCAVKLNTIQNAIEYINEYKDKEPCENPVLKYEIDIKYSNGDNIHAIFQNKKESVIFLKSFM